MNQAVIGAYNISKQFQQGTVFNTVLDDITVRFLQGDTYAITGPSGAGKSTLLHILAALDTSTQGNVLFNDQDLATMTAAQHAYFCAFSVGLVFQMPYLIQELSVIENVMLKGLIAGQSFDECTEKADALLTTVGLQEKAHDMPSTLSGGQQQRVAIVRALFNKPAFLLADEPTGNLDEKTGSGVIDFLVECHKEFNMGLIISSHDRYVVEKMEHVIQLRDGKIR